jgi:hypothetical protein
MAYPTDEQIKLRAHEWWEKADNPKAAIPTSGTLQSKNY